MFSTNFFLALSVLLILNGFAQSAMIRRFNYDARLYEHFQFDSRYVQYSRTEPADWVDIPAILKTRNITFNSMICTNGPGAWLFYPDKSYDMGNSQMYYLVVGEHCVRSDDINSVQPLGKMDEILDQGVLFFAEADFGSTATIVAEGSGSGEAGSIIFTGSTSYLLEGGGKKICLRPGPTVFQRGYCLLPNAKASLGIEGSVTVKDDCGEEAADVINLTVENCYGDGVHELYSDQDLTIMKLKEVCSGAGDEFSKTKFTILMEMWEKRVGMGGEDKEKPEQNMVDQMKVEILWKVLEIFKVSYPVVDPLYVFLIGHFYLLHINKAWENSRGGGGAPAGVAADASAAPAPAPAANGTDDGRDGWYFTSAFFDFCMSHRTNLAVFGGVCRTADQYGRAVDGGASPDNSWYEIANGQMFDTAIEQMWLIINTVIPLCNVIQGYITNDWTDLVYIFHKNFLDPVQEQWVEPGDWSRIYQAALHGYDAREQHRNIVACLRGALQSSPDFDPIGRPKSFVDRMMYKYPLPKEGEIVKPKRSVPEPSSSKSG